MAHETNSVSQPVRAGVFSSREHAEQAVESLLNAGFNKEQISVLCSDESKQRHFSEFEPSHSTPDETANAAVTGGALGGLLLGGLATATSVATGGLSLFVIAPGFLGGAVAGGLVGAMTSRGVDKEVADFYHQAVTQGRLLVAVEYHGPNADEMLARAEHELHEAGVEPFPLAEG